MISHQHPGRIVFYMVGGAILLLGVISCAIDVVRIQSAKGHLQRAIEEATAVGLNNLPAGRTVAFQNAARSVAASSVGEAITLEDSDVQFGNWNSMSRLFAPNVKPINALRITKSQPLSLWFGAAIGQSPCAIEASAFATLPTEETSRAKSPNSKPQGPVGALRVHTSKVPSK